MSYEMVRFLKSHTPVSLNNSGFPTDLRFYFRNKCNARIGPKWFVITYWSLHPTIIWVWFVIVQPTRNKFRKPLEVYAKLFHMTKDGICHVHGLISNWNMAQLSGSYCIATRIGECKYQQLLWLTTGAMLELSFQKCKGNLAIQSTLKL